MKTAEKAAYALPASAIWTADCTMKSDYDRAIADYSQAIRLNPNSGGAFFLRALSYSFRPIARLDQEQEPECACGEEGS